MGFDAIALRATFTVLLSFVVVDRLEIESGLARAYVKTPCSPTTSPCPALQCTALVNIDATPMLCMELLCWCPLGPWTHPSLAAADVRCLHTVAGRHLGAMGLRRRRRPRRRWEDPCGGRRVGRLAMGRLGPVARWAPRFPGFHSSGTGSRGPLTLMRRSTRLCRRWPASRPARPADRGAPGAGVGRTAARTPGR